MFRKYLIISHEKNLKKRYGDGGFRKIEKALKGYSNVLEKKQISTYIHFIDKNDPWDIKRLFDKIDDDLKEPAYFLIVGGDGIIPFFRLKNTCPEDGDGFILSDNPYASNFRGRKIENHLIPDRALSRFPDESGTDLPDLLLKLIENATRFHSGSGHGKKGSFGCSAHVWRNASRDVYRSINKKMENFHLSPPLDIGSISSSLLKDKRYNYFNLHGSNESKYWYGQKGDEYPVVMSPEILAKYKGNGSVVFSEACYGAYVVKKKVSDSLSLEFLNRDVLCFAGSTSVAYGPSDPPSSEADLLCRLFFRYIKRGIEFGPSFLKAKIDFARGMVSRQGFLDEDDKKTLLEFVLYADPCAGLKQ